MNRNRTVRRLGSETGAILIHAAVSLGGLVACTAFVVDYGMQLVSRNQAQNAADAGALAGAGALALGGACALADAAIARESALNVALQNFIWGEAPSADVTTPACLDGRPNCVQVSVYRDLAHGNPLPTMFAEMLGVSTIGVAATATAEWLPASQTDCLRPWAVPDRWNDRGGAWTIDKTFDRLPIADVYTPPLAGGAGTGLTVGSFCGTQVTLKRADLSRKIHPWQFVPVDLLRADRFINPGDNYYNNVTSCNSLSSAIGQRIPLPTVDVTMSNANGVGDLIAQDPAASWDPVRRTVVGGCMAAGTCVVSPRLVAIALFDPDVYETDRTAGGVSDVTIRNIAGFFVSQLSGSDIIGYLALYPGLSKPVPALTADAAFLRTAFLVK
jgi:hypothetical protein